MGFYEDHRDELLGTEIDLESIERHIRRTEVADIDESLLEEVPELFQLFRRAHNKETLLIYLKARLGVRTTLKSVLDISLPDVIDPRDDAPENIQSAIEDVTFEIRDRAATIFVKTLSTRERSKLKKEAGPFEKGMRRDEIYAKIRDLLLQALAKEFKD